MYEELIGDTDVLEDQWGCLPYVDFDSKTKLAVFNNFTKEVYSVDWHHLKKDAMLRSLLK